MLTNTDCTLFLATEDGYRRVYAAAAHWEEDGGTELSGTGAARTGQVCVFIPFSAMGAGELPAAPTGRDYILRGNVAALPDARSIVATGKAHIIQQIKKRDYGSTAMQHWEVIAL